MVVIALTGGIGSGKSTVSDLFAQLGIEIIDTDIIARDLVKPGSAALEKIKAHFGDVIIKDGSLDRPALRKRIFENSIEKIWLENLLHPLIRAESLRRTTLAKSPYCMVVIPLLFETSRPDFIDRVLVVISSQASQIQRVITRDHSSKEDVEKIIQSQVSEETRRTGADDIIENTGTLDKLKLQVKRLHEYYLKLTKLKL